MCACEPGYLCPKCAGTPDDPRYVEDEPADTRQVYADLRSNEE